MSSSPSAPTPRDRAVVSVLVVLLAAIAAAMLVPDLGRTAAAPGASTSPTRSAAASPPSPAPPRPLREGAVGTASTVNPLLATSRVDQGLVALVFSGLVRLGPGQQLLPDLAASWTTDEDARTWTFRLRDDARWHDGEPVTAHDVVFTVGLLRDPSWSGRGAGSWRDVTATAEDPRTVRFALQTPIGGFLQLATQPIVPAHLLADVPLDRLVEQSFNRMPVGSGPYRLESLDEERAILVPAAQEAPRLAPAPDSSTAPDPGDPSATLPVPTPRRPRDAGQASAPNLEMRFFGDEASLIAAFEAGRLDSAVGLPPLEARRLAATPDARLLRYPTSTLTAVVLNLRPTHPELRDPAVRRALLRAINRAEVVAEAWGGQASVAEAPIPAVSWAFDRAASPSVIFDPAGARRALVADGWEATDEGLVAPGGDEPFTFELLTPDVGSNTSAFLAGAAIAADWTAFGVDVTAIGLPPATLVNERLRKGDFAAAVLDINVGLDPDLYPLLGSTQGTSQGSNLSGLVDPDLDKLLVAARAPGTQAARREAYRALQARLAQRHYLLPIAFQDELVVVRDTVRGPEIRQVGGLGDRFWDVLSWRLADDR